MMVRIFQRLVLASLGLSLAIGSALCAESPESIAAQPARQSPAWLEQGVMYQIWLRSFTPEGSLKAATARLPDVADLGATIIYLTPVQRMDDDMRPEFWSQRMKESASKNPRNPYRIKDYDQIDPEFGSEADLRKFIATAHKLGLHVLMDLVYLHTGPTSVLLKHPEFHLRDAEGKILMTGNWPFPRLNFKSRRLREYLWANMEHWVKDCGADGFRCDCAGGVPLDFWEEARARLDAIRPDLVMLAEGTGTRDQLKAFDLDYSDWAFACQAVVTRGASAESLQQWWTKTHDRFPRGARLIYFSVNHDLPRADVVFGERGSQAVSVLNFTLDGVPFLYNGQEISDATPMDLMAHWSIHWDAADVPTGGLQKRAFYQRLCRMRREEPALKAAGEVAWLTNDRTESVLSYLRRDKNEEILVVVNLSNRAIQVRVGLPDRTPAVYRNLLTESTHGPKKSLSTDWIESGMQKVIRNPHDRLTEAATVVSTNEGLSVELAGFDYFIGKKQTGR
jgi:glycosidase